MTVFFDFLRLLRLGCTPEPSGHYRINGGPFRLDQRLSEHQYPGPDSRIGRSERCRSGRTGLTRNQVCAQAYRGFESHPLRHPGTKMRTSFAAVSTPFEDVSSRLRPDAAGRGSRRHARPAADRLHIDLGRYVNAIFVLIGCAFRIGDRQAPAELRLGDRQQVVRIVRTDGVGRSPRHEGRGES